MSTVIVTPIEGQRRPDHPRPVLLVEDSRAEAHVVRATLGHAGAFDVTWAVTLADAVKLLAVASFDCVVLDLGLPDADGLDTLEAALAAAGGTPVVVLTGSDDRLSAMEAVRRGADDYLFKSELPTRLLERSVSYAIERAEARTALKRSQSDDRAGATHLYAELLDAVGQAVVATDAEGRVVYWNTAATRLYGWTAGDVLGRSVVDFVPAAAPVTGSRATTDVAQRRRDGTTFPSMVSHTPLFDDSGALLATVAVSTDVTEQEAARASVARSERQLTDAQRVAHLGSWEWDVDADVVRWSEEHYRIFGQDPSTFVPSYDRYLACVEPADRPEVDREISTATAREETFHCRYRIVLPAGERRWIDTHGTPVPGGPGRRYVGTAHDVTDHHLAEVALRESEERYRTIVETAREGVWLIDADARTTFVNDRMAALLGRTPDEMLGTSVFDHFDEEGRRLATERVGRRRTGVAEQQDVKFVDKLGSEVWTVMEMTPVHDTDGRYQGALAMVTDITERHRIEAARRDSEARLAEAQRVAGMGSWSLDVGSGRLVWSDELYRLLGHETRRRPLRIVGLFERMDPDDAARARAAMAVPLLRQAPWASEVRIERPDGARRWLAVRMELVCGTDGVVSIHGTAQDVTNRRHAEEQVRFQAQLLDAVGEAIVATDLAGVVTYWGPGAEHLYGWTAAEAVGRPAGEVIGPAATTPRQRAAILDRLEVGRRWTGVLELGRRDGSTFLAQVTNRPVLDDAGRVVAVIAISSDVTEREEAKARLERLVAERTAQATEQSVVVDLGRVALSGAGAADIVDQAVATIVTTLAIDRAAVLEYHGAERMLVPTRGGQVGAGDACSIAVGHAGGWARALTEAKPIPLDRAECEQVFSSGSGGRQGMWATITVRHRTYGGLVVVTDDQNRVFTDHERNFLASVANVIGSVMERAELDGVKSDFVSTVSHELRTPVTSMLGYLEILTSGEAGDVPDEQARMLGVVERNGRRLLSLIEDLLTVSRLESERLTLVIAPVDVTHLVDAALAAVAAGAANKCLDVTVDVEPGLPALAGDGEQLERALVNLLANAVKFTPDGGRLGLCARAAGPHVEIAVEDTGIGIPRDEQQHLFTRFFRASTARLGAVQGTGLGLSIVKSIVDGHHGEVTVASAPGTGTTVRMVLPVFPAPAGGRGHGPIR